MVSALRKSFPHGAQNHMTLSQLHGVRSNAGAVNARGLPSSKSTGRRLGDSNGDESDDERCFCDAMSNGSGALVHVRQSRRCRARSAGVGGGFIVQFWRACISPNLIEYAFKRHTRQTTRPQRWQFPTISRAHVPTRPAVSLPSSAMACRPCCSHGPALSLTSTSSLWQCSVCLTS